jgi:ATP-dependent phosphofructokinase / diphosphate-dependent phosphofructokinase
VPAQVDRLAHLIAHDRHNPSRYSIVLISEGARLDVPLPATGPLDMYGHRHRINVAEVLEAELTRRMPDVRFLHVDVTYILRSGEPDVYDKKMAIFYANLVMNCVQKGVSGVMAAYRDGHYVYTDLPDHSVPRRYVDPADYNADRYRPNFERIAGTYCPLG